MIYVIIIIFYIIVIMFDFIPIMKLKDLKLTVLYSIMLIFTFVIFMFNTANVKVPSPTTPIKFFVSDVLKLK